MKDFARVAVPLHALMNEETKADVTKYLGRLKRRLSYS